MHPVQLAVCAKLVSSYTVDGIICVAVSVQQFRAFTVGAGSSERGHAGD